MADEFLHAFIFVIISLFNIFLNKQVHLNLIYVYIYNINYVIIK